MSLQQEIIGEVVKQVVAAGLRRGCTHDQVAMLSAEAVKAALTALEGEQTNSGGLDEAAVERVARRLMSLPPDTLTAEPYKAARALLVAARGSRET